MKYFKIILIFFLFLLEKTSFADENIVEILKKENNMKMKLIGANRSLVLGTQKGKFSL